MGFYKLPRRYGNLFCPERTPLEVSQTGELSRLRGLWLQPGSLCLLLNSCIFRKASPATRELCLGFLLHKIKHWAQQCGSSSILGSVGLRSSGATLHMATAWVFKSIKTTAGKSIKSGWVGIHEREGSGPGSSEMTGRDQKGPEGRRKGKRLPCYLLPSQV